MQNENKKREDGTSSQTGNVNPQMGRANKEMIAKRFSNKDDPLLAQLIKLIHPTASKITACAARLNDPNNPTSRKSEISVSYEITKADGEVVKDVVAVDVKGSTGAGNLNQLALFWLDSLLSKDELESNVGKALSMMMANKGYRIGSLMSGASYKEYGNPLQIWLGQEGNLKKFIDKGLNLRSDDFGRSVLLINLRQAGANGEDVFAMAEGTTLRKAILKEAISIDGKSGRRFVRISPNSKELSMSKAIGLKRVGGDGARGDGANMAQLVVHAEGLLRMILGSNGNPELAASIAFEVPSRESLEINLMNSRSKESEGEPAPTLGDRKALFKKIGEVAVDLGVTEKVGKAVAPNVAKSKSQV